MRRKFYFLNTAVFKWHSKRKGIGSALLRLTQAGSNESFKLGTKGMISSEMWQNVEKGIPTERNILVLCALFWSWGVFVFVEFLFLFLRKWSSQRDVFLQRFFFEGIAMIRGLSTFYITKSSWFDLFSSFILTFKWLLQSLLHSLNTRNGKPHE